MEIGAAEGVFELLSLLLTTVLAWVRPRQELVLENLLLRHQLALLTRPTRSRRTARLRAWDKLLWVLARRFCAGWREHIAIVTPDTVVRWHQQGWRLIWRWKSRSRGGRPHLSPEIQEFITTMSRKNRLWGTKRIRGELLKLGIVVSNRSIRRDRWRGPRRRPGVASRGICCAIEMPSTAATSAGGPDASVSMPSPRPFDRLVRTQLPNALSGHSAKNVWTT